MNRWQKIIGVVVLMVLAILNISNYIFYTEYPISLYFDPERNLQDAVENIRAYSHNAIKDMGYIVFANYAIALFMFIAIWRKGGKR